MTPTRSARCVRDQRRGAYHVFGVPTLVVFFEGRETLRKGRSSGLQELRPDIARPDHLLFD